MKAEETPLEAKPEFADDYLQLTEAQIERLRPYADQKLFKAGEVIFEEGILNCPLYIVLSGVMGFYQNIGLKEVFIAEVGPNGFSGEVSTMSGAPVLALARAIGDLDVLEISVASLKRLLVEDSELSDIFVSTFICRRAAMTDRGLSPTQVIGSSFSKDSYRIREFLIRNFQPFNWIDIEKDTETEHMLENMGVEPEETPVVFLQGTQLLKNPSNEEVAEALAIDDISSDSELYDVAVVGAGPAGLAASVNAASDGLSVVTLDSRAPGGQAANSSKIENYLGFPTGISGQELAENAAFQAQKFGVRLAVNQTVSKLEAQNDIFILHLASGQQILARSIIIACGAKYAKLPIDNLVQFENKSIFYGATAMEGQICRGKCVALVGAGNSAGQGAVFLSQNARHVYLIIRRNSLEYRMSSYLIRRIEENPRITIITESEVVELAGDKGELQKIRVQNNQTKEDEWLEVTNLFSFIGAKPHTKWLDDYIALDEQGFVKTGPNISPAELVKCGWSLNRMPTMFETALPRVYAVGDVRSDSAKRIASAVGEGSMCIGFVYRALKS